MTQEWLDRRFSGLTPADFGVHTLIFAAGNLRPPPGFHEVWRALDSRSAREPPDHNESLTIMILASPLEGTQSVAIRDLVAAVDSWSADAAYRGVDSWSVDAAHPGVYLVPHTVAPEDEQRVDADGTGMTSLAHCGLTELGLDGVIAEEPEGLDLVLAVRLHVHRTQTVLAAFNLAIAQRDQEKRSIAQYRDRIDYIRWSYLGARLGCRLPPVDHNLEMGALRAVPGYTFGRSLGSGLTGVVHMLEPMDASIAGGSQPQVIKVVSKASSKRVEDVVRFFDVLQIMLLLSEERWRHKNLTLLNEVYHTTSHILLRMDFGGPENLSSWLHNRHREGAPQPLTMGDVKSLIKQIVAVVAHLHQGPRICHRDIKPDNMIVNYVPKVTLKLVDFDFAKLQRDGELCRSFCGTVPFIAPEVALQERRYDGMAADIWSEGVVCFQVLCGSAAVEQIFSLGARRAQSPPGVARCWSREDGATVSTRFSRPGFMGNMLMVHCNPNLRPLLPVAKPLLEGMCTVDVDQRFSAQQTLDATEPLGSDSSSNSSDESDSSGTGVSEMGLADD